jgi:predicted CXXCH cytochrome family protein
MQVASRGLQWHAAIFAAALAAGVLAVRAYTQDAAASAQPRVPSARSAPVNPYIDPALCAQCHADIARNFQKTGMARSFYRLSPQNLVEDFQSGKPFYHEASDSWFAMLERGGKYYQRRWQRGFDGQETNVEEKQIDFVLGSGNHARTYLHLTGRNTLQQLPLGWYAEKGGYWAMNPGYDRADYQGSTRVIHYECMFCHNAYPRIPDGHGDRGAEAQYRQPIPTGIDCQRCHGPGQRHVEAAGRAGAKPEEIRGAIVNPSRLSPEREMEVCLECHLETTSRLLPHSLQRLDRAPFSYVPGQALAGFRLSFDRAPGKNSDFEVAHAAYRLRESHCFLKSAGKLRCTTCHDPHNIPRGEAAATHYNGVCRGCHPAAMEPITAHAGAANCVGCHMPRRRTDDAIHIVMTDHKIVRRPPAGDLLAEKKETHESPAISYRGEVVPYYPEKPAQTAETLLYMALTQIADGSNLEAGLSRLSSLIEKYHPPQAGFYSGLGEGYRSAKDSAKAILYFEEAARLAPSSEIVMLELGNALMESGQWAKAETPVRRAKTLRPDDAAAWGLLGWVLWQQDKPDKKVEAKNLLETAVKLDPDSPDLHNYLAAVLMGAGDAVAAEREFRAAVKINPAVAEWQSNLASLLASRGEIAEARYHFEQSIRLNPEYAEARLNYARLLANANQLADSEKEAIAAVEADPNLAAAHELWGSLLSAKGDFQGAVRELQSALRLKPDSGRAHYELGLALGRLGNSSAALEHLKMAAQGTDPAVRAAALQMLQKLGR